MATIPKHVLSDILEDYLEALELLRSARKMIYQLNNGRTNDLTMQLAKLDGRISGSLTYILRRVEPPAEDMTPELTELAAKMKSQEQTENK